MSSHPVHIELIRCPDCNHRTEAIVCHARPRFTYHGTCERCGASLGPPLRDLLTMPTGSQPLAWCYAVRSTTTKP